MRATTIALCLGACLTASISAQQVKTILNNGPLNNRYDIVILGDGYRAPEQSKFDADAQASIDKLFSKPSYGAYKKFFNVHTVFRASVDSGADHPDANPPIVKNTVYDASYNFGGTPRCLYIKNTSQAAADGRLAPDVEGRIIVLVNDTRYGGCAGTYAVSYTGSSGPEVQAHEFGHSFGRLADEYDYGRSGTYTGPEPSSANLTKDNTGNAKWPLWVGTNNVSAFEGGGYYATGLYRPKINCLMKSLGIPLCNICNEAIVKQAYVTVNPIENKTPANNNITVFRPRKQTFSISSLVPGSSSITWTIDGTPVATGSTTFDWDTSSYNVGQHTVKVTLKDTTPFVRKDPSDLLTSSTTWTVDLKSGSSKPGSYSIYGAGCAGSRKAPAVCLRVNDGLTNRSLNLRDGVTYAVRGTAPQALNIEGFRFNTSSKRSSSITVGIELYTESNGQPGSKVATGTMVIGPTLGWYTGTFTSTYQVAQGQNFYVAMVSPTPHVTASIVSGGTNTDYYRNDGTGGAWTGPYTGYAWAYRVRCLSSGITPKLSSAGVPEIGTSFDVKLDQALENANAIFIVGISSSTWNGLPLPFDLSPLGAKGCSLLAAPNLLAPAVTDAAGSAKITLNLPNDPTLVDRIFYNQFYVFDGQANALGLAWTNGGTGKVGKL